MATFVSKYKNFTIRVSPERKADFDAGTFSTEDKEMIKLLRASPSFGLSFNEIKKETLTEKQEVELTKKIRKKKE